MKAVKPEHPETRRGLVSLGVDRDESGTAIDPDSGLPFLWSYWEGERDPVIDLCCETIAKYNPSFRVLCPTTVEALGGGELLEFSAELPPPQRSDLIRLWLLHEYGGAWTDTDVICFAPLDWLPTVSRFELVGVWNKYQRKGFGQHLLATPWGCKAFSPVIADGLATCRRLLQRQLNGEHVRYGATSVDILSKLFKREHRHGNSKVTRHEHWRYNRVPWYKARDVFLKRGPAHRHEWKPEWNPNAIFYHLTNVVPAWYAERGITKREKILADDSFAAFLFQKALGFPPGVFPRSWTILQHLPQRGNLTGVEVGVFRGVNSRQLLQQLKDLTLYQVDPWTDNGNEERYRETTDGRAFDSQEKRDKALNHNRRVNAFAGDRRIERRGVSVEQAEQFEDGSLDFVFIDAEHSYEAALEDCRAWFPKLKPDGRLCGHDYHHPKFPGVTTAVDEFASEHGLLIVPGYNYTWFAYKENTLGKEETQTEETPPAGSSGGTTQRGGIDPDSGDATGHVAGGSTPDAGGGSSSGSVDGGMFSSERGER